MVNLQQVVLDNQQFYKITNSDLMRPFFMSIVSDANHWMFIASNGGLSAGRKDAEYALFPYYTDDKITESAEITGSKSIFRVQKDGEIAVWEPFSDRYEGRFDVSRNLYKSIYGNEVIFEEINNDLGLSYSYRWSSSNTYGFVRQAKLDNLSGNELKISLLDGLQNIVPFGVGSELQNRSSNLVDAYKRSELHQQSGLGIFALSAIIVDKAEPSEALKANVVWSLGLDAPTYLLSSLQLKAFRKGAAVTGEADVKGEKGAYFVHKDISLSANEAQEWTVVANVNQDHAAVANLIEALKSPDALAKELVVEIKLGTQKLIAISAAADGLQLTADQRRDTRHFSNVLFNNMRGGIFDDNYVIEKWDFAIYLKKANAAVAKEHLAAFKGLPEKFLLSDLKAITAKIDDPDFQRLCLEYLPLKFSRRHGDPSRPWNRFSINTHSEVDGSKILDYQGNWRDIFQNWEALAHSFPDFIEGMILKFLNATTFDGYNPYRVTKDGFDWETIEADDPWSYIGYWGDHQIIYLLKFLEFIEKHQPGVLDGYLEKNFFVYANVPYRIKDYEEVLKDPKDTVDFDHKSDEKIRALREEIGADGALVINQAGEVHRTNMLEKLLATVLAKVTNFIPGGGIWMNTQRPEWNDANNALVGNGVSMVTLYYLNRFMLFFDDLLSKTKSEAFSVSEELLGLFDHTLQTLKKYEPLLAGPINDGERGEILHALGRAASAFRHQVYDQSFKGAKKSVKVETVRDFCRLCLAHFQHTIAANRRTDDLFHAYNLMTVEEDGVSVTYLSEMLEGQVAVLSANYLKPEEALTVTDALKASKLFREDQYSYILYPNKDLPGFLEKNTIPAASVSKSDLMKRLVADDDRSIVIKAVNGKYHFNGNFNNVKDLRKALDGLADTGYAALAMQDRKYLERVFEEVFNHKEFTGRSGTFFGYEGLGSIYWHMVSKLQLAVLENCKEAIAGGSDATTVGRLLEHYYEINEGTGVHKSPELYGAFPTDPYSHTPAGKGAQQPGMTGQVKEDILNRFGELGVFVKDGKLQFLPTLLRRSEFLTAADTFNYVDVNSEEQTLELTADSLAFTYCQVPVEYVLGDEHSVSVTLGDGTSRELAGGALDEALSDQVFRRTGDVVKVCIKIPPGILR